MANNKTFSKYIMKETAAYIINCQVCVLLLNYVYLTRTFISKWQYCENFGRMLNAELLGFPSFDKQFANENKKAC